MICPYNRKTEVCHEQYVNDLVSEESGVLKGYNKSYIVEHKMLECPKEGCGAWYNGRCNYNQGNNG